MTANHIPVYGHGQVDARLNLAHLTCGDLIWIVIDAAPQTHRIQVRIVAVEPILGQLRYQAWIIGHYRRRTYRFRARATLERRTAAPDRQHRNRPHRLQAGLAADR